MSAPIRALPVRDALDAVSRHVGHHVEIVAGQDGARVSGLLVAVAQLVDESGWVAVLSPRTGSKVGTAIPLRLVSTVMRTQS